MSRDNSYSPPVDFFPDSTETSALLSGITAHLDERLPSTQIGSKGEYVAAAQTFPDVVTEYICILSKNGTTGHSWLWLLVLRRLAEMCRVLCEQKELFSAALDSHVYSASSILAPAIQQVARHCEIFFEELDETFLFHDNGGPAYSALLELVDSALSLSSPDQAFLKNGCLTISTAHAVGRVFRFAAVCYAESEDRFSEFKVSLLPTLVTLAKTAFMTGSAHSILPLAVADNAQYDVPHAISENYLSSIMLDPHVTLSLITDYFRYSAFCLVTCAAGENSIDETAADKADIFLKVLFNLPHLQVANYLSESGELNTDERKSVPAAEREEIAFFYLLNYLLRMRTLSQFVDPDKYFVRERRLFITSFNQRCGAELELSASASSSRAGSVVSMTRVAESAGHSRNIPHHVTISSILFEGTYKEKIRLVADFFNLTATTSGAGSLKRLVENFDMSSIHQRTNHFSMGSHDVSRIVGRMDPQQSPGKCAYVRALDMIVRLLQLVSLKFFCVQPAGSFRPSEFLEKKFRAKYSLRDVLSVKDLLRVDGDDSNQVIYRVSASEDALVAKQLRLLEVSANLKKDVQKLI